MTSSAAVGVILAQIGTPDAPSARAVRPYLKRFLSDRRVIDYSPLFWQPLLRGIILRVRPRRSAALYSEIWEQDGSPLLLHSLAQQAGIRERLGAGFQVELALSYGGPDMERAFSALEQAGVERIVVAPLFPQYSSTTTASVYDAACFAALGRNHARGPAPKRKVPSLRLADSFHNDPRYIRSMAVHLKRRLASLNEMPDYYLLSFHGIPVRYADSGDPYPGQCHETARLLAEAMGWQEGQWGLSFQSRFGPERWVGPSTSDRIAELAKSGVRRPFLFSPGLVTDCLETLHELAVEGREQFAEAGGNASGFAVAPCLNAEPEWLDFMADFIRAHSSGWAGTADAVL